MRIYFFLLALVVSFSINSLFAQDFSASSLRNVNSTYDELNPVLSPDGRFLFFTIAHHPENIGGKKDPGDIWFSSLQPDNTWSAPQHAGASINNRQYNAVAGFSADGNLLYLHNHYSSSDDPARTQGISVSKKTAGGWSKPENINIPYFLNRSAIQSGSISASGRYFVFAADSYGSYGAEDLYVCSYQNGRWTEPRNLGIIINSAFQEMSPFLAADDVTLYFSTNGRGGKGSFDIYSSTRLDDSWTNWSIPQNLTEVNTEGRELFFRLYGSGSFALYTSTLNSDGYGDIKLWKPEQVIEIVEATIEPLEQVVSESVEVVVNSVVNKTDSVVNKAEIKTILLGYVRSAKNQESVQASIRIKSDGEEKVFNSNDDGYFEVSMFPSTVYHITLSAAGYISKALLVNSTLENERLLLELQIDPAEVGVSVNLKNVLFERSTTNLLPESYPELDMVASFLKENPTVEIELAGHTDNRGSHNLLMKLSNDRVQVVKQYLIGKGIEEKRIRGKGYGGTKPIIDNYSEESRKLNRRVEFTIIKK